MTKIFFFLFLLLSVLQSYRLPAQTGKYSAELIPAGLKSNANAVVRDEEISIAVTKPDEAWITCKKVVTILNPNGKFSGLLQVNYNKSRPVQSLSGELYDAGGELLRKFKKSDFEDVSDMAEFSLYEDNRVKRMLPAAFTYPYTVAYQYKQKYKFTLYLPGWLPVVPDNVSIQRSSYRISSPMDMHIRYYLQQLEKPAVDSSEDRISYTWLVQDMPASGEEPYSPPLFEAGIPMLLPAPGKFEYYRMKGDFHNWKEYGLWVYEHLLKDRESLPESTMARMKMLTKDAASPREKVRIIYHYVQRKSRYVSIQVGKGGFEPVNASEVDKVGYGDCKALANYTLALLKAVDIPAYYTEVNAGDGHISLLPGFAGAGQGNHVILCVPLGKDTTWLECTDKQIPFGYLGSFTDDRNVLVCTPQGGVITRTPRYADSTNVQQRTAQFTIDTAGNLSGTIATTFKGLIYEKRMPFETLSYADKIKQVKQVYPFLQMSVPRYSLVYDKQTLPEAREALSCTSPRYAAINEHGMSIPINPVNRLRDIPEMIDHRKSKVYIAHGFVTTDSLCYALPAGFRPSLLPHEVNIRSPFGRYTTQIKTEADTLVYLRTFHLRGGYYPPEDYGKLVDFMRTVSRYDRENFLIAKKQG